MMRIDRFRPFRRLARWLQAVLIIGIPFLRINGESALRFDVPSLRLYFFGTGLLMNEFFLVLVAIIFFIFLIALITVLYGRIWCGWVCPQTVLIDLSSFSERTGKRGLIERAGAAFGVATISVLVSATLIWYFVSPYEFFDRLHAGTLGSVITGFWVVMAVIIFLDLMLLRHRFCATICPYAKLQGVLYDSRTMVIAFDQARKDECRECAACVRSCPVGIDIRKGPDGACINCTECIDVCRDRMEKKDRPGLIGYFWGQPGPVYRRGRPGVVMSSIGTAVFFVMFIVLIVSRGSFDVTVLADIEHPPVRMLNGEYQNSYVLAFENKGPDELTLVVRGTINGEAVRIAPDAIKLGHEEYRKVRIEVFVKISAGERRKIPLNIMVSGAGERIVKSVSYFLPEKAR